MIGLNDEVSLIRIRELTWLLQGAEQASGKQSILQEFETTHETWMRSRNRMDFGRPHPANIFIVPQAQQEEVLFWLNTINISLIKIAENLQLNPLPQVDDSSFGDDQHHVSWCLGVAHIEVEQRPILRGSIDVVRRVVIGARLPEKLIVFLKKIPGIGDHIKRENHGHWGYHYHYLDSKMDRSDTLLTFSRSLTANGAPILCWERHAEGGKFKARPEEWGSRKRLSVYDVCYPDTRKWALKDFKNPDQSAAIVWP